MPDVTAALPRAAAALCARYSALEVKATVNALLVTLARDVDEAKVPAQMRQAMALAMVDVGVRPGMTRREWDREVLQYLAVQPVQQELLEGLAALLVPARTAGAAR